MSTMSEHSTAIPPEFYQGIGQVVVEIARLEYLLAEMASHLTHPGDDAYLERITASWGRTKDAYGVEVDGITDDDQLRADLTKLMEDVENIRRERNKLAHSVIALDPQEGWSVTPLWLTWSPRTPDAEPQPLPGPTDFTNLLLHITGLNGRTVHLRNRVMQRLRTTETPTAGKPTDQ